MAKKKDESTQLNFMEKYRENIQKVQALGNLAVQQFLGSRANEDPRKVYLLSLEVFKNMANVQLEVIMEIMMSVLGVPKEKFFELLDQRLTSQVNSMEQDLCVKSWDKVGNPILDLKGYAERTAKWPV